MRTTSGNARTRNGLAAIAAAWMTGAIANATPVADGTYRLHNHPDGGQRPPLYGLRLDGLDGTTGSGVHYFTFDFDYSNGQHSSMMHMVLDEANGSIRIFGTMYGGLNDPANTNQYAASGLVGWWDVDFTYTHNIRHVVDGNALDDVRAGSPGTHGHTDNTGTLTLLNDDLTHTSTSFDLIDYPGGFSYTFQFGDDKNPPGHRGFAGLSGWGWVNHSGRGAPPYYTHTAASDWLFTAERVPVPGAALLGSLGLMLAGAVRRRLA